jgi:S1-C subfamily serine protease
MPFGIKFITEGVLITGFCDVKGERSTSNPSNAAGLKVHDVIISINGVKINDASQLSQMVESSKGKALTVEYRRGEEKLTTKLTPVYSS